MSLRSMMKDNVTLVKANGERFENIKAYVQPGKIFTADVRVPIEKGDTLLHILPNGAEKPFLAEDPGYTRAPGGRMAHYEVKVRKV